MKVNKNCNISFLMYKGQITYHSDSSQLLSPLPYRLGAYSRIQENFSSFLDALKKLTMLNSEGDPTPTDVKHMTKTML